jgi:hypothetical protein
LVDWSNLIKFPGTLDSDNLGGPEGLCSHCNDAVEWGLDLQHDVQIDGPSHYSIQSCLPLDVESKSPAAAAGCGPDSEPAGGRPKLFNLELPWPGMHTDLDVEEELSRYYLSRPAANMTCSLIQVSKAASAAPAASSSGRPLAPGPGPTSGLKLVAAAAPSPAGATDSEVPSSHYCPATTVLRCSASDSDSVSARPGARSDSDSESVSPPASQPGSGGATVAGSESRDKSAASDASPQQEPEPDTVGGGTGTSTRNLPSESMSNIQGNQANGRCPGPGPRACGPPWRTRAARASRVPQITGSTIQVADPSGQLSQVDVARAQTHWRIQVILIQHVLEARLPGPHWPGRLVLPGPSESASSPGSKASGSGCQ